MISRKIVLLFVFFLAGIITLSTSASAIGVIWGTYDDKYEYLRSFAVEGNVSGFGTFWSESPNPFQPPYWRLHISYGSGEGDAIVYQPFIGICSNGRICGFTLGELII